MSFIVKKIRSRSNCNMVFYVQSEDYFYISKYEKIHHSIIWLRIIQFSELPSFTVRITQFFCLNCLQLIFNWFPVHTWGFSIPFHQSGWSWGIFPLSLCSESCYPARSSSTWQMGGSECHWGFWPWCKYSFPLATSTACTVVLPGTSLSPTI